MLYVNVPKSQPGPIYRRRSTIRRSKPKLLAAAPVADIAPMLKTELLAAETLRDAVQCIDGHLWEPHRPAKSFSA
jgi:hypothetical protein